MLLGDFSLNSDANAMLIACSGGWQPRLLTVQLHECFPQQQRQFKSFAPTFGHLLLALYHTVHCPLGCAEAALCGDMDLSKIK